MKNNQNRRLLLNIDAWHGIVQIIGVFDLNIGATFLFNNAFYSNFTHRKTHIFFWSHSSISYTNLVYNDIGICYIDRIYIYNCCKILIKDTYSHVSITIVVLCIAFLKHNALIFKPEIPFDIFKTPWEINVRKIEWT